MHYYCNTSLVTIKWVCKKESGHQGLHTFKGPIMLRPTANYTDSDLLPKRTRQWWIMRMMKRWREENRQHIKVRKSWGWKIWAYFPPPQRYNSSWWLFDLSKPLSFLCCKESWCRVVTATWHPVTSPRSLRGAPALYVSHLWACRADGGTTVAVLSAASVCLLPLHFPAAAVGSVMVMVFFFLFFCFLHGRYKLVLVRWWVENGFVFNHFTILPVTVLSCHFTVPSRTDPYHIYICTHLCSRACSFNIKCNRDINARESCNN